MAPTTYEEFWPYYVAQHRDPTCRALHAVGDTLAAGCIAAGVLASPGWLFVAPVVGFGFAWVGHLVYERNLPAFLGAPWWSFRAGLRMYRLMLLGRMEPEVRRVSAFPAAHA